MSLETIVMQHIFTDNEAVCNYTPVQSTLIDA